jgi:hypothetical protein
MHEMAAQQEEFYTKFSSDPARGARGQPRRLSLKQKNCSMIGVGLTS